MAARRRLAAGTLLGAGAVVGAAAGVLFGETSLARRAIGTTDALPPSADDTYGDGVREYRVAVLGDSSVVGYGMSAAADTPTAMLGEGLAHLTDASVSIRCFGKVGARSADLAGQVEAALLERPDAALIVIGANDITHRTGTRRAVRHLSQAVDRLLAAEVEVVVGTCPDLSAVRPIPQPLRSLVGALSHHLARRQAAAVVEAGARAVSLGDLLTTVFGDRADQMFGADRFHPSAVGYANMVSVLVPSLAAALYEHDHTERTESVAPAIMPIEQAVETAMNVPGTEITPAGRWAGVRRRLVSRRREGSPGS